MNVIKKTRMIRFGGDMVNYQRLSQLLEFVLKVVVESNSVGKRSSCRGMQGHQNQNCFGFGLY